MNYYNRMGNTLEDVEIVSELLNEDLDDVYDL